MSTAVDFFRSSILFLQKLLSIVRTQKARDAAWRRHSVDTEQPINHNILHKSDLCKMFRLVIIGSCSFWNQNLELVELVDSICKPLQAGPP